MIRRTLALLLLTALPACADPQKLDRFGVAQLHPTLPTGREWSANWTEDRVIPPYSLDPNDPLFRNEDGELHIAAGIASLKAGITRCAVRTPKSDAGEYTAPPWRNVEMTIYVRRGSIRKPLSYQAFDLAARSGERHSDKLPCDGTSYHATARFDGRCGFKKEIWHTGGYTPLRPDPAPRPWDTVPPNQWIGMKLICRNCNNNTHVRLELHLDTTATNNWQLISTCTDTGDWLGENEGCDRPRNYVITEGRPAVYFRTDEVDVDLKHFTIREIAPLP